MNHANHILRRITGIRPLAAALALAACGTTLAAPALPPGISGVWYNPAQPGHGFSVELYDDDRALAYWYVFDASGRPVHLYIEGRIEDRAILGEAYLGRGMRFGEFDPADHELQRWGRVDLSFAGCGEATLAFDPDGPAGGGGFSAGTMTLRRLTPIAGQSCGTKLESAAPQGRLEGQLRVGERGSGRRTLAAVDAEGRLWAIANGGQVDAGGIGLAAYGEVVAGEVTSLQPGQAGFALTAWPNAGWTRVVEPAVELQLPHAASDMDLALVGSGGSGFAGVASVVDDARIELRLNSPAGDGALPPIESLEALAGEYRFVVNDYFLSTRRYEATVSIDADGSVCVAGLPGSADCAFTGSLGLVADGEQPATMVGVVLRANDGTQREFSGRGWRIDGDGLVLVTSDDELGLGFVLDAAN